MISSNYHAEISTEVVGQRAEVEKHSDPFRATITGPIC